MKSIVRSVSLPLLTLLLVGTSSRAEPADLDPQIARHVDRSISWYGLTGVAIAVLEEGVLVHQSVYGESNVSLKVPVSPATGFQLSSTTKALTGTVAALLIDRGLLDPDAGVGAYLEDLPESWRGVRLEQLLSHTSGLPEVLECDPKELSAALACVFELPLRSQPGDEFLYNQTNYLLVQKVLEKITGKELPALVRELVFQPAGMLSSAYAGSSAAVVPGLATSYYPAPNGGLRIRDYDFPDFLLSAAGLTSPLQDLIRFDQWLGSDSRLSDAARERMWQAIPLNDGTASSYGLGWDIQDHAEGHRSVGHEGGSLTTIRKFMPENITVIVLSNGSRYRFDPDRLAEAIATVHAPGIRTPEGTLQLQLQDAWTGSGGDISVVEKAYRSFLAQPAGRRLNTEGLLNRFGYDLLARSGGPDAEAIFRLNVERYPESGNAHDSLGEAIAATGAFEEAIEHYRESLRLDPSNENATAMIEELKQRLKPPD